MPKPLAITPARIRAILRKAGHDCAKAHTTRVRGWKNWQPGYLVRGVEGDIALEYMADFPREQDKDRETSGYRKALDEAGVKFNTDKWGVMRITETVTSPPSPKRAEAGS